jgi:hypothetical protein
MVAVKKIRAESEQGLQRALREVSRHPALPSEMSNNNSNRSILQS